MPDRPDYFRCPNCCAVSFQQIKIKRPNGSMYVTIFFSCTVCTAVFLDPVAYTRGFEDRPRNTSRPRTEASPFKEYARINQRRRARD